MPIKFITTTLRTVDLTSAKTQALGTMAIVGPADAGDVNTPYLVSNSYEADNLFGSSSVLSKAITSAFKQDPGPEEIWAVRESSSAGNVTETKIQTTGGNKVFSSSIAPISVVNAVRVRVSPSTIQSKSEDHSGSSLLYRQDGAATYLFAGITDFNNNAANVYCVVTDKNHIAVEGITVNIDFPTATSQAASAYPSTITDASGVAVFPITSFGLKDAAEFATDTISIWSVGGDLDSLLNNSSYTTKNGIPDDDVLITYDAVRKPASGRVPNDIFAWYSETDRSVFAFGFDAGATTGLGGFLGDNISVADSTIAGTSGANIDGGTVVKALTFSGYGIQGTPGTDSTATYLGWAINAYTTESTSNIDVVLQDSVPAAIASTDNDITGTITNKLNPIIHTYDLLANMSRETLGAGQHVAAPITANVNLASGNVYLGEEIGVNDLLYLDVDGTAYATALNALQNKEFRIISACDKYSSTDLRTFTKFVESRKDILPTFGIFALQPKGLSGGNGKDYTISSVAQSNYIKIVAHDHSDTSLDVASAVSGAMFNISSWDSSAALQIKGIINDDPKGFSGAELDSYDNAQIDVIDFQLFVDSITPVLSRGFCTGDRKKADIQLTLNYIDVAAKRALSTPGLIARSRVNYQGLTKIVTRIEVVLQPLIQNGIIGGTSRVYIPLLNMLKKPSSSRMATEIALINLAQSTRDVTGEIQIDYQGSIETINLGINFY